MKGIAKAVLFFAFLLVFNGSVFSKGEISQKVKNEFVNACKMGDISKVEAMLKQGIDPNVTDDFGSTGLMVAAYNGHLEIIKLLLKYGANINQGYHGKGLAGMEGNTALNYTIDAWFWYMRNGEKKETEKLNPVFKFLIDHGIDLKHRDQYGLTYLMIAASKGVFPLVKLLVLKGMDVNERTPDGETALIFAAMRGHYGIVKFLLDHGANPNVKVFKGEYKGYTALKFAKEKGYKEIENLLKQYGAKE